MSSIKGRLVRLFGGVVLQEGRVASVDRAGEGFRRIRLESNALLVEPGNKLQVLLPTDDVRTYTPIPSEDGADLLGWRHAGGPGARWISEVKAGDTVRFLGAQGSLSFPAGPIILVGDETSVAVAASFYGARPGQVQVVFEAQSPDDLHAAAEVVGLRPLAVTGRGDVSAIVEAVLGAREQAPEASIGLTGGSVLLVAVRDALRKRGIGRIKSKTYWVPGRTGLD